MLAVRRGPEIQSYSLISPSHSLNLADHWTPYWFPKHGTDQLVNELRHRGTESSRSA